MNATPEQINAVFASPEPYMYLHVSADGTTQPNSFNIDDEFFAPVEIVKTPTSYSVTVRRNGQLLNSIEFSNATFGVLTAARATFEPMGFGTRESWNTLIGWAAAYLC